jgi:hypothetical protein
MSNRYSAANLKFPGDDARLDLTDLFVFPSPGDPATTVLIIDLNPYTTGMSAMPPFLMKSEFHPDGIYRINVDTDADARADAAFTFVFSEFRDGSQTGTAYYATGPHAASLSPGDRSVGHGQRAPRRCHRPGGPWRAPDDQPVRQSEQHQERVLPAAYPNGRGLTDDMFSARFAWLTNGRVGPDGLKPHEDMLAEFPCLGPPNRYPV